MTEQQTVHLDLTENEAAALKAGADLLKVSLRQAHLESGDALLSAVDKLKAATDPLDGPLGQGRN